jgi:hypothetical protein
MGDSVVAQVWAASWEIHSSIAGNWRLSDRTLSRFLQVPS